MTPGEVRIYLLRKVVNRTRKYCIKKYGENPTEAQHYEAFYVTASEVLNEPLRSSSD